MEYVFVKDNEIIKTIEADTAPESVSPNKGIWLPVQVQNVTVGPQEDILVDIIIEADRVVRTQTIVPWPLERIKVVKHEVIITAYATANEAPFTWDFGNIEAKSDYSNPTMGESLGPAGKRTLQTRAIDEKNWIAAQIGALTAVSLGAGETIRPIKTSDNVWVQTTANQVMQVLVLGDTGKASMFGRQFSNLANFGVLKKLLEEASTPEEVNAIDETQGWF